MLIFMITSGLCPGAYNAVKTALHGITCPSRMTCLPADCCYTWDNMSKQSDFSIPADCCYTYTWDNMSKQSDLSIPADCCYTWDNMSKQSDLSTCRLVIHVITCTSRVNCLPADCCYRWDIMSKQSDLSICRLLLYMG